jgi:hypothetical protein
MENSVKQFKIYFIFKIIQRSKPFALMTALHTRGILSTSFMRLSPGLHFNKQVCLVKSEFVEFLPKLINCVVTRYGWYTEDSLTW